MARLADIVRLQPVFGLLSTRTPLEFVGVVAGGAMDLSGGWTQRQGHARGRLPSLHLSKHVGRWLDKVHPPFRLRTERHACRVRPHVVAAATYIIEIVLHVEGDIDAAFVGGLRNTLVAKKAGRLKPIFGRTGVGIQRRVSLLVVAFEALAGCIVRRPVSEKARVLQAVGDIRIVALERQVVAGRAGDSAAIQRCAVVVRDRQITDGQVRAMAAGEHAAAITVALHATVFSCRMTQTCIPGYRGRSCVAGPAGRLVPVRILAGGNRGRHENGHRQYTPEKSLYSHHQ